MCAYNVVLLQIKCLIRRGAPFNCHSLVVSKTVVGKSVGIPITYYKCQMPILYNTHDTTITYSDIAV